MKKFIFWCFMLGFIVSQQFASFTAQAQEPEFRFSNWPLLDFSNKAVLTSFSENHFGVDVAAVEGEVVNAVADGKVYWTYSGGSHGISVGVEHSNGYRTTYLHLSERMVKKGQQVKAGELIGKVGQTGTGRDAEATHLHLGLIAEPQAPIGEAKQRYLDPMLYGPVTVEQKPESVPQDLPSPVVQPNPVEIPNVKAVNLKGQVTKGLVLRNKPIADKVNIRYLPIKKTAKLATIDYKMVKKRVSSKINSKPVNRLKGLAVNEAVMTTKKSLHLFSEAKHGLIAANPSLNANVSEAQTSKNEMLLSWLLISLMGYTFFQMLLKKGFEIRPSI